MKTKVRPFGGGVSREIEHESDECACCEAARSGGLAFGDVVFLEEEGGKIRRVRCVSLFGVSGFLCREVTADAARAEIEQAAK